MTKALTNKDKLMFMTNRATLLHYFTCEICNKDMIDTNLREIHICDSCLA